MNTEELKDEVMTEAEKQKMNDLNAKYRRIHDREKKIEKLMRESPKLATDCAIRLLNLQPKKANEIEKQLKKVAKKYDVSVEAIFQLLNSKSVADYFEKHHDRYVAEKSTEENSEEKPTEENSVEKSTEEPTAENAVENSSEDTTEEMSSENTTDENASDDESAGTTGGSFTADYGVQDD